MAPTTDVRSVQFADYTRERREEIDEALTRVVRCAPGCPPVVADAMQYSLLAGGKRLRPILTLAAAEAVVRSGDRPAGAASSVDDARRLAMPSACAVELVHTYSLTHDDLPAMDNDTMRRGRPTLHVAFGEAIAMLAGDGMLTEAFALVAREPSGDDPSLAARKLQVVALLGAAAGPAGMVGGQAVDLQCAGATRAIGLPPRPLDLAELQSMHERKTGALIRAAAVSGAIMAGASPFQMAALDAFAREIGLVFQIVDDILDVEGASEQLGKTAGKDAAAGKPTYPALVGLERARQLASDGQHRAERALARAGLTDNWLVDISRWVVSRRC